MGSGLKELPDPTHSTCSRIGKRLLASSLPIEQQDVEDCSLALMILRDLSVRYDTKRRGCESMGHPLTVGNNFYMSVNAVSEKEADKIFAALSAGGRITIPLEKAFWGAYFGIFTDKFGIQWMINYDYNQN